MAVEFNEPSYTRRAAPGGRPSRLSRLVIAAGLARDSRSAQWVLLLVGVVSFALTGFLWWQSGALATNSADTQPAPADASALTQIPITYA